MCEDLQYDVVTFGECMLRFSPPEGRMLEQAECFRIDPAGTESNTAAALARMGARVAWWSALPDTSVGRWIAGRVEAHGVDVSHVIWTRGRAGVFFWEPGHPPRGSRVVYDRARSAVSLLDPASVDWAFVRRSRLLHLSGITPALSESCRKIVDQGLTEVRRHGCRTSFDINYRAKLWTPGQAAETLTGLLDRVDILISTEADIALLFGIEGPPGEMIAQLHDRFGHRVVVLTLAKGGAVGWSETTGFLRTGPHSVERVDRLGAGDAFDAGLLYGLLQDDLALGLSQGAALAAVSYAEQGDMTWTTREEIAALAKD